MRSGRNLRGLQARAEDVKVLFGTDKIRNEHQHQRGDFSFWTWKSGYNDGMLNMELPGRMQQGELKQTLIDVI